MEYSLVANTIENSISLIFDSDSFEYFCENLALKTGAQKCTYEWQSKYNDYLVTEKPTNSYIFDFIVTLYYSSKNKTEFAEYTIEKELDKRRKLENLLYV